jgi:hypothetical protein
MDPGATVKIAFSGNPASWPADLMVWNGVDFTKLPHSAFPAAAQDLSVLKNIRIRSGETLYYMLFISVSESSPYFEVDCRVNYIGRTNGKCSPIPFNSVPANGSVQALMSTGVLKLTNTTGRNIKDLQLVVLGGK